jgi:hypothetical protein
VQLWDVQNRSKLPPETFKAYIQGHNINFCNQSIQVLYQNEPYKFLGIQLLPSLTWKIQIRATMTKLNEQCKLLKNSPAIMKQKIHMIEAILKAGIAYSFYAVAFSIPTINKLDKTFIRLQKSIYGHLKCAPNIMTQLPTKMFILGAFSLKNAYLKCIGEQFRNAFNDPGKLGDIYQGLTNHILAQNGGVHHIPCITKQACVQSPLTRTFYLLKILADTYLHNIIENFPLKPTPLETTWLS